MKSLLVVGCLCLVAAMVRAETDEMNKFMELAKQHVEICSKELGVSEDEWTKLHDSSVEGGNIKTAGCMNACIMKRLGMMEPTEDVAFNLDKIKEVVDKIASDPDAAAAQMKITTDCIEEVKGKNEACEAALVFSQCYTMKSKPE